MIRPTPRVAGGALAIAMLIGGAFEGIRYAAYLPTPNDVPTICRGHTLGVKMGDTATQAQCDAGFEQEMKRSLAVVDANVKIRLTEAQRGALADFVYNMGTGAFKTSTMLKKFNAGDVLGGCIELIEWRKQKGQVLDGLVRRRTEELKYCLGAK